MNMVRGGKFLKSGAVITLIVISVFLLATWKLTTIASSEGNPASKVLPRKYDNLHGNANVRIHVIISADHSNIQGMITAMNSVVQNTNTTVSFHLITVPELQAHLKYWILNSQLASTDFDIRTLSNAEKEHADSNVTTSQLHFVKLFSPELENSRIIHLSSDCVVQGDLTELGNIKMKPGTLGAFSDDCTSVSKQHFRPPENRYIGHVKVHHPMLRGLRIKPSTCSFDPAIFVADFKTWKRYNVSNQLEYWHELARRVDISAGNAGDDAMKMAMLLTFHQRVTVIPPLWNVRHLGLSPGSRYSLTFLKKAKLLQWDGPFKPWRRISSRTQLWEKYFVPDPLGKFRLIRMSMAKH